MFEFPNDTITYFYFIPDLYDRVLVPQTKQGITTYIAAIAIDGLVQLNSEGRASSTYQYVQEFRPHLIKLSEVSYKALSTLFGEEKSPFDPFNALCVGIIRTQNAGSIPFLCMDEKTNIPVRTDLRSRRGAEVLMAAIIDATQMLPVAIAEPVDRKKKAEVAGDKVEKLSVGKTKLLHALLDKANELPDAQIQTLLHLVEAAISGKYVIKLNPSDVRFAAKQTSGGKK